MAGMRVRFPLVTPLKTFFHQDIAQPGRARARGARGHGIEARFPDHFGGASASLPPFEPTAVGYHPYLRSIKSSPMRVSVAIRATGSSAISRRPILARISQAQPGQFYVFLAQTDRAGQACEAPDASSILAEDTFSSDSSTDRAVGYGPANEGSSPSPNTISSRRSRVTIYAIHTLSVAPCSFPRRSTRPFQVTRPGLSLGVLIWAKGSIPFYLTISKE